MEKVTLVDPVALLRALADLLDENSPLDDPYQTVSVVAEAVHSVVDQFERNLGDFYVNTEIVPRNPQVSPAHQDADHSGYGPESVEEL